MYTEPDLCFFNSRQKNMSISDVIDQIKRFIQEDPASTYRLAIGTDSQVVGQKTVFATAVHVHRVGKGSWGCISKSVIRRRVTNTKEKIAMEISLTLNLVLQFSDQTLTDIYDLILPHMEKGADLIFEAHLDIGKNGATRQLIKEMVSYFSGVGVSTKIKPYSYAATSYANRYSKYA